MMRITIILIAAMLQNACTLEPVNPWDRNILSRPDMQLDTNRISDGYDDHIYFSKEASTGGSGLGGGGCGCN